jgi:outer membrane protein
MKRFFILVVVFGMSLSGPNAFSQEKEANSPLTLEECIQLALRNRPELDMATMDILHAEQQVKEAQSFYYPHLNLNAGYTRFNEPFKIKADIDVTAITGPTNVIAHQFGVELPSVIHQEISTGKTNWTAVILDLNQPIYTFGRITEGVKQAQIGQSIVLNQKEKKKNEIVTEVKKGYYQYHFSKKLLQLVKEAAIRADVVVKMVKIAYETSIPEKEEKGTTRLDYLKARNFQSEVKAKLSEANKNFKLGELSLKMAIGLDPASPLLLKEISFESLPRDIDPLNGMREQVLARNPDLKNFELGIQLYDSRWNVAKKEYLPKIGILGQYTGPEDRFGNKNYWYAGIGLTMSLFDGFLTRAKIGQAEAQFHKIKNQKMVLESVLSVQVEHLHMALNELNERIEIFKMGVNEAKERIQLAADGYATGITEYDDLLLSQRAELEMTSSYFQSLYLYQMVKSEIEFVSGTR